jgi:predicted lipoprotein
MKRFSEILMMAALVMNFAACGDDDNNGSTATEELEKLSMNAEWINYATATASELLDDCIMLWAAWNGPNGIQGDDLTRIGGSSFFSRPGIGSNGYAEILKTAGAGNTTFPSQEEAIRTILEDGFANISNEVGSAKIGEPNGFAKDNDIESAVYAVESWYSWNSITDYSDNIISIKNGYCGRKSNTINAAVNSNSISALTKTIDADLDAEVNDAIDGAYNAIKSMTAPFRNNLTGAKVDAAMDACADLTEIVEGRLQAALTGGEAERNYTEILRVYADEVVVPTYLDLKNKAWTLYNAVDALRQDPTNQTKLNAACEAWRAARVPWEQSEAILFGPASEDLLGLDPSMDSWPLSQEDIAGILQNTNLKTVEQFIGAISSADVRGFHTLELLLFKDGNNRTVRK